MRPVMSNGIRRVMAGAVILVALAGVWFSQDSTSQETVPQPVAGVAWDACPLLELQEPAGRSVALPADPAQLPFGRVEVTTDLTVSYTDNLGRYGQLTLAAGGRMFHPNNGGCVSEFDDGPRFIVLEDGVSRQNPVPVPYLEGDPTLRSGSIVSDLSGWLGTDTVYMRNSGFEQWVTLEPDSFVLQPAPRPEEAPRPGGTLTVAGFNVENYFTTLGQRGARDRSEFERQHTKLVAALSGLNAHLIAVAEVENDDGVTLARLVSGSGGLAQVSGDSWDWVQGEGFGRGNDDIGLAFLYRSDLLAPVGPTLADPHAIHNRPPLAQRFRELASGEEFTVVMNHLKSRGGCDSFDTDEGSGCWDQRRDSQVRQTMAFIEREVAPNAPGGILLLGDFNAYALEAPITRLTDSGWTDLLARFVPPLERYTYVFEPGWAGYMDHALADQKLAANVCGAAIWHINADEPTFLSYSGTRFGPDHYEPGPFRSSDHDPVLVGLDLSGGC